MRKNHLSIAVALLAAASLSACSSIENRVEVEWTTSAAPETNCVTLSETSETRDTQETQATEEVTTPEPNSPDIYEPFGTDYAKRREMLAYNGGVWSEQFRLAVGGNQAEMFNTLECLFPSGFYWNTQDASSIGEGDDDCLMISDTPCNHNRYWYKYCNSYESKLAGFFQFGKSNMQCLGFANMLSDILYGKDAEVEEFDSYDSLCVGDTVRLLYYDHSVIITEKTDEYVKVAECNDDYQTCKISWGRQLSRYTLRKGAARFFRRIPTNDAVG